jgi:N1-aminopropylagmatine ureohydrolase
MTHPEKRLHFGDEYVPDTGWEGADIVILPLCYEAAPSYGTGAGHGPYHILNASTQLENIDEETLIDWSALNIHTHPAMVPDGNPECAVNQMKQAAEKILREKKFLLALGGDHAVSIGPITAAADQYPDLGVLQIDAHLDLRDEWNGSRYNHACVMRRAAADRNLPAVQVGIRSFSKEEYAFLKKTNFTTLFAHDMDASGQDWMEKVIEALPDTVYVTIDLDGLDPSVLPGTGTPEPGGLSYRQLIRLLRTVGREKTVVAADITELSKIEGFQVSEFTAAKIATKILVYCFKPV